MVVAERTLVRFFVVIIRLHYEEIACVISVGQGHFLMPLSLFDFFIIFKAVAEASSEFRWHHVRFVGHRLLGLVFIMWGGFELIIAMTLRFFARFHFLLFLLLWLPLFNRGVRYDFIQVLFSILQVHRILLELREFLLDPPGKEAPVTDQKEFHKVDEHCRNYQREKDQA